MKLYEIYFSPTGGTKKVSDLICDEWNFEKAEIDLIKRELPAADFNEDDICLIAVPSFGGRVPEPVLRHLSEMRGNRAAAVLTVVYGNRHYDDTLLELKECAQQAGFRCVAAIAAVAEHSIMHQFAAGRPDVKDQEQLKCGIKTRRNGQNQKFPETNLLKSIQGFPLSQKQEETVTGAVPARRPALWELFQGRTRIL